MHGGERGVAPEAHLGPSIDFCRLERVPSDCRNEPPMMLMTLAPP